MPTITNNQTDGPGIGLPNGVHLAPGASVAYPDDQWARVADRPVMRHYLDSDILSVSKAKPEPTAEELEAQEQERIRLEQAANLASDKADEAAKVAEAAAETAKLTEQAAAVTAKAATNTGRRN